jgi:hypothetical protein
MDVGMPGLKAQALESGTRHTNTNLPYGRVSIHDTIIFHIFYLFQATAYSTGIFRAFTLIFQCLLETSCGSVWMEIQMVPCI